MRRSLVALALATLAACGSSTGPNGVTGTYTLQTVGGAPLPAIIEQTSAYTRRVQSGSMTLNSDGSWSSATTIAQTTGTSTSTINNTDQGSYAVNGSAATWVSTATASEYTGTVANGQITVTIGGAAYVYRR